jgi:hypothetical protein
MYTLNTVVGDDAPLSPSSSITSPLLSPDPHSYGSTPSQPRRSSGRVIFHATLKMACIFLVSTILLGGTLWIALPTLEE